MKKALFIAAFLVSSFGSAASFYLAARADVERDELSGKQHHVLVVPGSVEVFLLRTGAYGIYYLHQPLDIEREEALWLSDHLQCSLESESGGNKVNAAADYLETNTSWSEREYKGVLLMSITVDKPGAYTFDCRLDDSGEIKDLLVSLGPNTTWEKMSALWEMRVSIFSSIAVLASAVFLSVGLVIAGLFIPVTPSRAGKGGFVL